MCAAAARAVPRQLTAGCVGHSGSAEAEAAGGLRKTHNIALHGIRSGSRAMRADASAGASLDGPKVSTECAHVITRW